MKTNFQKRIFLYVSAVLVVLVLLFSSLFSVYVYRNLLNESKKNLNELTDRTARELNNLIGDMDKLALYISTNPDVMDVFTKAEVSDYSNTDLTNRIITTLTSITIPNSSSHFRISLYNKKGNYISTGIPYSKKVANQILTDKQYLDWYKARPIIPGRAYISDFHEDYWSDSETRYLSLYREIFHSSIISHATGIIEVQCPSKIVTEIINFDSDSYFCTLLDEKENLIYQTPEQDNFPMGKVMSVTVPLDNGWTITLSQPQTHITKIIFPVILYIILISLAVLLCCLLIIFTITKRMTEPLRRLTYDVKNVTLSNLSVKTDSLEYPDEFAQLNSAFSDMFDRLEHSMDENVKMKTCEMRANMIALQSQMNPHFLYNILTIIKVQSREGNNEQVGFTCDYLARMLRYMSAYSEDTVPLSWEMEQAELYLKLMKIRYEDQFLYTIKFDPALDLNKIAISKFSIQPILENCFQHGFKKVLPVWQIHITTWVAEDHWYLSIEDNGYGADPQVLTELNKKVEDFLLHPSDTISNLTIGGMGLINTMIRLKQKYKEEITLTIEPLEPRGTLVTLGGIYYDEYSAG